MKSIKKIFQKSVLAVILFYSAALFAVEENADSYQIHLQTDRPTGIYRSGEQVTVTMAVYKDHHPINKQLLQCIITDPSGKKKKCIISCQKASASLTEKLILPGATLFEFNPLNEKGLPLIFYRGNRPDKTAGKIGIFTSPEAIAPALPEPADFQKFWNDHLAELAEIPLAPIIKKVPAKAGFSCWDVQVQCLGKKNVSGYLTIPLNAGERSLPAIVQYHGAGVFSARKIYRTKAICFNVNAHGIPNGQSDQFYRKLQQNELKNYWRQGIHSRNKFYFRDMFLRVRRSLDYLKSRPEWDGFNLIAVGGSQGGAQAMVAGALDPQVTIVHAAVPALCDHGGIFAGRTAGWPLLIHSQHRHLSNSEIMKTAVYYDVAYFARRIRAETFLVVGLIDRTCPSSSIFAAYNNISAPKHIFTVPDGGHIYNMESPEYQQRLQKILQ